MRALVKTLLRSAVAAGAAGITVAGVAGAGDGEDRDAVRLAADYDRANAALMKGDSAGWMEGIGGLTDDFVLMAPFGGEPSRAADYDAERIARMGRFFRNGNFNQQLVASYASRDMVVLATIERSEVEVGGLPRQPWALRVTSVFMRQGKGWALAHRHADPLVAGVTLEQAAALAGAKAPAAG